MFELRPNKWDQGGTDRHMRFTAFESGPRWHSVLAELVAGPIDDLKPSEFAGIKGVRPLLMFFTSRGHDLGTPVGFDGGPRDVPAALVALGSPWDGFRSYFDGIPSRDLGDAWAGEIPEGYYRILVQTAEDTANWLAHMQNIGLAIEPTGLTRIPRCLLPGRKAVEEWEGIMATVKASRIAYAAEPHKSPAGEQLIDPHPRTP